jgi:oligoribonuclease NrnB/cAMP/cGMP phosphodiesterase (DHH superfamily)
MLSYDEIISSGRKKVVWYHKKCADGFGAALVLWRLWSAPYQHNQFDVTYVPVNYGEPLPIENLPAEPCDLLMVDFSAPRDVLIKLAETHNVVVFDHHKTAKDALAGLDFCEFDLSKSGARMVADWAGEDYGQDWLVDYIEDRDLWNWKLTDSREISAAIASYPYDFPTWDRFDQEQLFQEGKAILRYQKQLLELQSSQARFNNNAETPHVVINATAVHSELGEFLLQKFPEAKFAAIYVIKADGGVKFSLRSRSAQEFDCTRVVKMFPGGGGHPCAAGFDVDADQLQAAFFTFMAVPFRQVVRAGAEADD